MALELWSGTVSPFSLKVRIALAEKGLPYRLRDIPWTRAQRWGPKPDAFLAVSPRGEVPVLVHGELAVVDSTVILEYLEDAFPEVPLSPRDPQARAVCRMWEDMADHYCAVHLTTLIREVFLAGGGEGDETAVADARAAYRGFHVHLDRTLSERPFLCDDYGLADIALFVALGFAAPLGAEIAAEHTHLSAWFASVKERKAVGPAFDEAMRAAAAA